MPDLSSPPLAAMTLLFRIEPGCLGPDGRQHIETFCKLAEQVYLRHPLNGVQFEFVPRYDKQLPEREFLLGERTLNRNQAIRLLEHYGLELARIETQLDDTLSRLISHYTDAGMPE